MRRSCSPRDPWILPTEKFYLSLPVLLSHRCFLLAITRALTPIGAHSASRLDENLRNARPIVDTFRPLVQSPPRSRGGDGYGVEFVASAPGDEIAKADDVVDRLLEAGWLPEHVVLLTTQHRHPVQKEYEDKDAYWSDLAERDLVFYSTVSGFKGLERPAVVLVVDGFHEGVEPSNVMYTGMSRARDLLVSS